MRHGKSLLALDRKPDATSFEEGKFKRACAPLPPPATRLFYLFFKKPLVRDPVICPAESSRQTIGDRHHGCAQPFGPAPNQICELGYQGFVVGPRRKIDDSLRKNQA